MFVLWYTSQCIWPYSFVTKCNSIYLLTLPQDNISYSHIFLKKEVNISFLQLSKKKEFQQLIFHISPIFKLVLKHGTLVHITCSYIQTYFSDIIVSLDKAVKPESRLLL